MSRDVTVEMRVFAEAHSDDHAVEVSFDATPWFEQASDAEIRALARIGWGGNQESDAIAYHCEGQVGELQTMFSYVVLHNKAQREHIGFECHVDEATVLAWLRQHRPELLRDLEGPVE